MKRKFLLYLCCLTLICLIMSSCGKKKQSDANVIDPNSLNTITYGFDFDVKTLDPEYISDSNVFLISSNIFEGLVRYKSETTEIEPCLAVNWVISKDNKEYTFGLRKDVLFHDGTKFDANAVIYNVEHQMSPNRTDDMVYAKYVYDNVEKIEKIDNLTVKFVLKDVNITFLSNLAMSAGAPICSPTAMNKYGKELTKNPIGTGPFKFENSDNNQKIVLKSNDFYWGDNAKIDNLVFVKVNGIANRISQLQSGTIDIINVNQQQLGMIKQKDVYAVKSNSMDIFHVALNCSKVPFINRNIRQAIFQAINRQAIVDKVKTGDLADTIIPSYVAGYNNSTQPYQYDLEKAKQMLKDEGDENLNLTLITVIGEDIGKEIQTQLAKIGVSVKLEICKDIEYKDKVNNNQGDMYVSDWVSNNGDADSFMYVFDSKDIDISLNESKYNNPEVDAMIYKGRTTPNGPDRNKIYQELEDTISIDAPWIPVSHSSSFTVSSSKVQNLVVHPTGIIHFELLDKQ